jgi:hypothetical protein
MKVRQILIVAVITIASISSVEDLLEQSVDDVPHMSDGSISLGSLTL